MSLLNSSRFRLQKSSSSSRVLFGEIFLFLTATVVIFSIADGRFWDFDWIILLIPLSALWATVWGIERVFREGVENKFSELDKTIARLQKEVDELKKAE